MCREVLVRSRAERRTNINNKGFGVYFSYTKLNFVIFDADIVILGFDLLLFGSNSMYHGITMFETLAVVSATKHTHPASAASGREL